MKFIILFSGIGGFDLGLEQAGHECLAQVEFDDGKRRLLESKWSAPYFYKDVKNVGQRNLPRGADLIVGGFPCQDLSVAGRRAGLAGERSGLWFEFRRILSEILPSVVVIENVPGLLSAHAGADFTTLLQGLSELGYHAAWRVLDAQHFGVPQRRKCVFIVGTLGTGRCAEVLFEREGSTRYLEARWSTPQDPTRDAPPITGTLSKEHGRNRGLGQANETDLIVPTFQMQRSDSYIEADQASTITKRDYKSATDLVAYTITFCDANGQRTDRPDGGVYIRETEQSNTLTGSSPSSPVIQTLTKNNARNQENAVAYALKGAGNWKADGADNLPVTSTGVRRLTPLECERLQGFPDGWTKGYSDSKRYQWLGDAVAVPVIRWIGEGLRGLE